jgi:hypothetical protein
MPKTSSFGFRSNGTEGVSPAERHLRTTGHLMASECEENGWQVMTCVICRGPIDIETIPGSEDLLDRVFGKIMFRLPFFATRRRSPLDVTMSCPCCSRTRCPHKPHSR